MAVRSEVVPLHLMVTTVSIRPLREDIHPTVDREGHQWDLVIQCGNKDTHLRIPGVADHLAHRHHMVRCINNEAVHQWDKTVRTTEVHIPEAIRRPCRDPLVLVEYAEVGSPLVLEDFIEVESHRVLQRLRDLHRRDRDRMDHLPVFRQQMAMPRHHNRDIKADTIRHIRLLTGIVPIRADRQRRCTMHHPNRTTMHRPSRITCTETLLRARVSPGQDHLQRY
mmetsp:Transcript_7296/g.17790  ORF Transcript_7296/g.17790 Transcript_7296/m.17790 type:complete len:223 (+) Transcript_7296:164-832(+)